MLVGLTGGIGSGKSTVADMFAALGARVIDTDQISRQLTQPGGNAIPALRSAFGSKFFDAEGALNRTRMRELVFSEPAYKAQLESILHPLIHAQVLQQAAEPTCAPYTLVVVPLLFESQRYSDWMQRIITVDCPEEIQVQRTLQRGPLAEHTVRAIMAQQMTRSERMRRASDVIQNDGDLDHLRAQVVALHRQFSTIPR